jgi:hypothetical protein
MRIPNRGAEEKVGHPSGKLARGRAFEGGVEVEEKEKFSLPAGEKCDIFSLQSGKLFPLAQEERFPKLGNSREFFRNELFHFRHSNC